MTVPGRTAYTKDIFCDTCEDTFFDLIFGSPCTECEVNGSIAARRAQIKSLRLIKEAAQLVAEQTDEIMYAETRRRADFRQDWLSKKGTWEGMPTYSFWLRRIDKGLQIRGGEYEL